MLRPNWTVLVQLTSPEESVYTGTSWEFFQDWDAASRCYERHKVTDKHPTLRPYYHLSDYLHLSSNSQKEIGA